jgi:uncharacterized protein YgbK (DUF1537 family)
MSELLLAYYGDDFTGSTDALESLASVGARAVLFTSPPTADALSRYGPLEAVGVAGATRSLAAEALEAELGPALEAVCRLRPRHVHYKVCSTFDSSAQVGSIGRAIEVGRRVVGSSYVPLLVGSPALGRYCAFGNLFAAEVVGGGEGRVFRLDRHPTASRHPITPMGESDLRRHLSDQTPARVVLFDLLDLELPSAQRMARLDQLTAGGAEVVLFDALYAHHMERIGSLIDQGVTSARPRFSVGSSGIEMALGAHWHATGTLPGVGTWPAISRVDQVLVVSGSCSPVTESQIAWALSEGFAEVALDTPSIAAAEGSLQSIAEPARVAIEHLISGQSVVVHTSKGNRDPRIEATAATLAAQRKPPCEQQAGTAQTLGAALGRIVNQALETTPVRRICIAGGDTASFVSRALGIEAIEMVAPLAPGAPLCRVHARGAHVDGLEVNFKGGQVGQTNYFGTLLGGRCD